MAEIQRLPYPNKVSQFLEKCYFGSVLAPVLAPFWEVFGVLGRILSSRGSILRHLDDLRDSLQEGGM